MDTNTIVADNDSKCDQHISATLYEDDVKKLKDLQSWTGINRSELFRRVIRQFHSAGPDAVQQLKNSVG